MPQSVDQPFSFHENWFLLLENMGAFCNIWMQGVANSIFHLGLKIGGLKKKIGGFPLKTVF